MAASSSAKLTPAQRAAARAAAEAAAVQLLAPADEYFGPLKQSVVGMRNEIRALGWNYDVNHDIWHQTFVTALLTERAVRDWVQKYPRDGQIPRTIFLLQRLYTKVLSEESRGHAHQIAQWLLLSYSKSPQARQMRKTLAAEHLAPLPSPTPSPEATPQPEATAGSPAPIESGASAYPSAYPSASPSASPPAYPSPYPSPPPSPYPYSSPSPSPSPSPSASPSPSR